MIYTSGTTGNPKGVRRLNIGAGGGAGDGGSSRRTSWASCRAR